MASLNIDSELLKAPQGWEVVKAPRIDTALQKETNQKIRKGKREEIDAIVHSATYIGL